jgi:hypothetical protein
MTITFPKEFRDGVYRLGKWVFIPDDEARHEQ